MLCTLIAHSFIRLNMFGCRNFSADYINEAWERKSRHGENENLGMAIVHKHTYHTYIYIHKCEREVYVCVYCIAKGDEKREPCVRIVLAWCCCCCCFSWKCAIKSKLQLVLLSFCRVCFLFFDFFYYIMLVVLFWFHLRLGSSFFVFDCVCSFFVRKSLTYGLAWPGHIECMWCKHLR